MRRASVAIAPPEAERGGPDDRALVRALVAGEPWAAAAVWNRHAPKVFRIVARVLGPGADAEDLTQDVFVSVFSKVPGLRDPDALGSFIVSVTLRMLKWELRRRRVRRILHFAESAELPEQAVEPVDSEAREALGRLYAILDTLNADDRTVFVLRHMEGMSLPEIAEAARVSLATVKRRLSRATELVSSRVEHDASLAGYYKKGTARDEP
ncbi:MULTISPECIES: RNA polymerase sigma factor [Sorangium]|uniref:RNA polymerase sigma factor n=1 Tax=Sorangium TaxID=39643 RepID=UPI001A91E4EF|nr:MULTISPECIES: sigma-70 family RNA polymerase sigma factor [Sorangium]